MSAAAAHPAWCVEDRFEPGIGVGDSHLSAEIALPATPNTALTVRIAQATTVTDHPDSTLEPVILLSGVSDREAVWVRFFLRDAHELSRALRDLVSRAVLDSVADGAARIVVVSAERLELVDEQNRPIAFARKTAGRDMWIIRRQGILRPEWIEGELAARARLEEIGEQR